MIDGEWKGDSIGEVKLGSECEMTKFIFKVNKFWMKSDWNIFVLFTNINLKKSCQVSPGDKVDFKENFKDDLKKNFERALVDKDEIDVGPLKKSKIDLKPRPGHFHCSPLFSVAESD